MARYLAILLYFTVVASQRNSNILKDRVTQMAKSHDVREIQRQNRITQQIITNYLERKLFPNRRPQHQAPSVDEIIQIPGISEDTKTLLIAKGGKDKDDDQDPETLQSVGSENIDNILDTPSNTYRGLNNYLLLVPYI
uniref:CSON006891 protein n=1 Tax=Culicoides sonorensis TaxID=179676 RepID=A0A336M120_CULSO